MQGHLGRRKWQQKHYHVCFFFNVVNSGWRRWDTATMDIAWNLYTNINSTLRLWHINSHHWIKCYLIDTRMQNLIWCFHGLLLLVNHRLRFELRATNITPRGRANSLCKRLGILTCGWSKGSNRSQPLYTYRRGRFGGMISLIKKCMLWHGPSSLNWVHPKWRANS
jgi:hypothetical protein